MAVGIGARVREKAWAAVTLERGMEDESAIMVR